MRVSDIRTLFITRNAPYPPSSGAPVRNWVNIQALARFGPVAVFSVGEREPHVSTLPGVTAWRHHDEEEPRPAFARARSTVRRLFVPREFHVTNERYAERLSHSLQEFAREFEPDLTVIENWLDAFPAILREVGGKIVVDAHNIESLLQSEMLRKSRNPLLIARSYVRWFLAKDIERRLFESADEVWLTSPDDLERLNAFMRRPIRSRVIPNAVDVERYAAVRAGGADASPALPRQQHSLCFVGLFEHPPNARAAHVLIDDIFPRLRERFADARLVLVGRRPTPHMLRASERDPAIVVTGYVTDTRDYLAACDLTVVPLTTGGGTRLKIIEAFAAGIPVVSTSVGAEGLAVRDGEHLLLRESVDEFVAAATRLWESPEFAASLAERAYGLVDAAYSTAAIACKTHAAATALLERDVRRPPLASMPARVRTRVCVAVPAIRRPERLGELLRHLARQDVDSTRYDLRIVVIANDRRPAAESRIREANAYFEQPLEYVHVPEPGPAAVKNAALAYAAGRAELLAMIDDDEVPDPAWLSELLRVRAVSGADAVVGRVLTRFAAGTPKWAMQERFFEPPRAEDGAGLSYGNTANCLVVLASVASLQLRFDPGLSCYGGEDTLFFMQLRAGGGKIVYAAGAVATETLSVSRTRLRSIAAGKFRHGNSHARCALLLSRRPVGHACIVLLRACSLTVWSLCLLPARIVSLGRAGAAHAVCDYSLAFGELAGVAGFVASGYARAARAAALTVTAGNRSS